MKFNPEDFKKAKRKLAAMSPEISDLFRRHRVTFEPQMKRHPYESLIRSIAHQQLHGKAAETILGRMLAHFTEGKFPSPEQVLKLGSKKLRACGFSASKVKSIQDIALRALDGTIPTRLAIRKMPNEEIIQRLTQIYGVGQWTVEMLLIFQLGRLDVWPVDDFGVRRGFQIWRSKRKLPTPKDLRLFTKHFHPYQTIMALHLWREADLAKGSK